MIIWSVASFFNINGRNQTRGEKSQRGTDEGRMAEVEKKRVPFPALMHFPCIEGAGGCF